MELEALARALYGEFAYAVYDMSTPYGWDAESDEQRSEWLRYAERVLAATSPSVAAR